MIMIVAGWPGRVLTGHRATARPGRSTGDKAQSFQLDFLWVRTCFFGGLFRTWFRIFCWDCAVMTVCFTRNQHLCSTSGHQTCTSGCMGSSGPWAVASTTRCHQEKKKPAAKTSRTSSLSNYSKTGWMHNLCPALEAISVSRLKLGTPACPGITCK